MIRLACGALFWYFGPLLRLERRKQGGGAKGEKDIFFYSFIFLFFPHLFGGSGRPQAINERIDRKQKKTFIKRNKDCVCVCCGRRKNDRKGLKVGMKVLCVCGFRLYMLHIHTPGNPEGLKIRRLTSTHPFSHPFSLRPLSPSYTFVKSEQQNKTTD